ncbi:uncharacterized protein K02A2.6-like [Daphnia carinata]|uniref:uncharacterized protein K02A2.6-like n=1 Tax=Daphnia carinata TaxID=120202 RepID=UPI002579F86F|nr:uncharacterized protein K02A2.6-like [Daphnia carinata]
MAFALPAFESFSISDDPQNVGARWKKWVSRFETMLLAMNIVEEDSNTNAQKSAIDKRRLALMLHYAGSEVADVYDTLSGEDEDKESYPKTKPLLQTYFQPKQNIELEVYKFRKLRQEDGETMDAYVTRLRKQATLYDFPDDDREIKFQVIQGCLSSSFRKLCLRGQLSLSKMLEHSRSAEAANHYEENIEKHNQKSGNAMKHKNTKSSNQRNPSSGTQEIKEITQKLQNQAINSSDESSDESVFSVCAINNQRRPMTSIQVSETKIAMMIDTGSICNMIGLKTFNKLNPRPVLKPTNTVINAYGNQPLDIKGKFSTIIRSKHAESKVTVYVSAENNADNLLSCETAKDLKIVKIINATHTQARYEQLKCEFTSLFKGTGKMKNYTVKRHIDPSVPPVTQKHRRVGFHLRKAVEEEIQKLLQEDIIEPVTGGPTPWVSPCIVVPKPKQPGKFRVCVDMRAPNKAIMRTRHLIPTIEDLVVDLNGAKFFSKLDMNQGYHQLELMPESRFITTFASHRGLFRYKRLNFGINCAAEIFDDVIRQIISGIPGVVNRSDDILVTVRSRGEHDQNLREVLRRLQERNLTLNFGKCEFGNREVTYFGLHFSEDGIAPDKAKVQAIDEAAPPSGPDEVSSFLGMITFCSRFIADAASISEPLRKLTHKKTEWAWSTKEQTAFQELKNRLKKAVTLAYYDVKKSTSLIVDASPTGLGTKFSVITHHKPLETIFNKPLIQPPARIERWLLKLQQYEFEVKYQPGKNNPADFISRHPAHQNRTPSREEIIAENYVNHIAMTSAPKAVTIKEVAEATARDKAIQVIAKMLDCKRDTKQENLTPGESERVRAFKLVLNQLSRVQSTEGLLLLKGSKLVIPQELTDREIKIAHQCHPGIVKTKSLIREKVWFPGIDKLVERRISSYIPCMAANPTVRPELLLTSQLPSGPWTEISVDFAQLPDNNYLVIYDDYSRFPVIQKVSSTSANAIIRRLKEVFAMFGIQTTLKSDNGPPFSSKNMKDFAEEFNFQHRKVTPLGHKLTVASNVL